MRVRSRLLSQIMLVLLVLIGINTVFSAEILVLAADGNQLETIPLRELETGTYLSLTRWAEAVDGDLEWDYVTGVAEMRFRDNRIRWVDSGKGAWVNGRMQSMPGETKQIDGDIWLPIEILDSLVDPLWEGDLTWDSQARVLRRLEQRTHQGVDQADLADSDDIIIMLDAGHGGRDYGSIHSSGQYEKDITLKVMNRLADVLMNRLGVQTVLTRPGDYVVTGEERVSESNRKRADLFLSLHIAPQSEMHGKSFMVYHQGDTQLEPEAAGVLVPWSMTSARVAELSKQYAQLFGEGVSGSATINEFGVMSRNLDAFRGLSMPGIMVELSWESSFYGDLGIANDGGCNRLAEAIFDGLKRILNQEEKRGQ